MNPRSPFWVFAALFTFLLTAAFTAPLARGAEVNLDQIASKEQVTKIIGTIIKTFGPVEMRGKNDEQDHLISNIRYAAAEATMGVTVFTFDNSSAAGNKLTKAYLQDAVHWDDCTLSDESGLGDRAFWATSTDGNAAIIVLKGARALTLVYVSTGEKPAPAESHHAALRSLAEAGLKKL